MDELNEYNEYDEYDEEDAVKFIINYLPQDLKEKFSEDTIYYILDLICEFYEKNDYLNDDDEEKEEKELISFIIKQSKKDAVGNFLPDELLMVLRAEEAYMDTLDFYE
jgi:ABC-type multidrug transport system ATPase subunit